MVRTNTEGKEGKSLEIKTNLKFSITCSKFHKGKERERRGGESLTMWVILHRAIKTFRVGSVGIKRRACEDNGHHCITTLKMTDS